MVAKKSRTSIGPRAYASWRATRVGALTETLEQKLILEMMGALRGFRVLDAGCGDGALVCAVASRGAIATGIDSDSAMLAAARSRADNAGIAAAFVEGSVEQLPFADASFDVVAAVTVLCFIPNTASVLGEMARVVRPGGLVILGELGRWSLWAAIRRFRGWLGSTRWRAAQFRTARKLRKAAEQAGLSVTSVRGAVFYPPLGVLAHALAPLDPWLGRCTTCGAAFIALRAVSTAPSGLSDSRKHAAE